MPIFGGNNKKKEGEMMGGYPKQAPPTFQPGYPQGMLVQQQQIIHVVREVPQQQGLLDRLLDGPDFRNVVHDPTIPPAPGTFAIHNYHPHLPPIMTPSSYGYSYNPNMMPSSSSGPPGGSAGPSAAPLQPPPSYEDVLAQEIKKKL